MRFEDSTEIDAPVARVWALTLDVESWPATTPTMTSVERLDDGPITVSSTAKVKQPGMRAAVWTVTTVEPERCFAWGTKLLGTRMTGSHRLAPSATGTGTTNTLHLDLEGPLAGVLGRVLGGQMRKSLAKENAGFKQAAESIDRS